MAVRAEKDKENKRRDGVASPRFTGARFREHSIVSGVGHREERLLLHTVSDFS